MVLLLFMLGGFRVALSVRIIEDSILNIEDCLMRNI